MLLSVSDLKYLSKKALVAARRSGEFISGFLDLDIVPETKEAGSSAASQIVTQVDYQSQEIILKELNPTLSLYDLGILAEEDIDDQSRLTKDYFWCIDPLDGTLPFVEKIPGFSVSISLIRKDGVPMIGVIYDPVEQRLYHAIKGLGAFKNEQSWQIVEPQYKNQTFTFIANRSLKGLPDYQQIITDIEALAADMGYKYLNHIIQGGAAMNAIWVLEEMPACYFALPKKEDGGGSLWDYAASACIFNEIGANAGDIFGNALELNRKDSTFLNHRGILYTSNNEVKERFIEMIGNIEGLYKSK